MDVHDVDWAVAFFAFTLVRSYLGLGSLGRRQHHGGPGNVRPPGRDRYLRAHSRLHVVRTAVSWALLAVGCVVALLGIEHHGGGDLVARRNASSAGVSVWSPRLDRTCRRLGALSRGLWLAASHHADAAVVRAVVRRAEDPQLLGRGAHSRRHQRTQLHSHCVWNALRVAGIPTNIEAVDGDAIALGM